FVSTLVGRLSDRRPIRRQLLIAAATAGCASSLLTAFIREYWLLLAVATTVTAAAGAAVPQSFAWVAGPPVAAALLAVGGFRVLYEVSAALNAAGAVIALVWLRPSTVPAG